MRRVPAFTLLEAVLALVILSSACVACLTMRAQSLASAERLVRQQRLDRDTDAVFQMFLGGLLPPPQTDPQTGLPTWRGEHLGRPFTITRERVAIPNPAADQLAYATLPEVSAWRYELTIDRRTSHFYWHR